MHFQLKLNDQLLQEGDFKTLSALFADLSGLNFARGKRTSWLDKMSASESYETYLKIKAAEFGIARWEGKLELLRRDGSLERTHFFSTHQNLKSADLTNTRSS